MAQKGDKLVNKEFGVASQHAGRCNTDTEGLKYLLCSSMISPIKSIVDIGCGLGGQTKVAREFGLKAMGIDGDPTIKEFPGLIRHDYNTGPLKIEETDLGWCSAFIEHIHERYLPNVLETFKCCKYVLMTYAPPGLGGRHHANCKPEEYWIDKMTSIGFTLDILMTSNIRKISEHKWIPKYGLFFRRNDNA